MSRPKSRNGSDSAADASLAEKKKARDGQPVLRCDEAPGPKHVQVISERTNALAESIHVPGIDRAHPDRHRLSLVAVRLPIVDELLPGGTAQGQRRVARAPLIGCEVEQ